MSDANNVISADKQTVIKDCIYHAIDGKFEGVEIVDVAFYKQYGRLNVEVFLWKKSGISLDDCESVHNVISCELDNIADIFPDEYVLNVSSSGLDRKIVTNDDFRRTLDTEIECVDDKKNKAHGILLSYDDENIVIKTEGKKAQELTLQRKLLTKVQPYVRF